MKKIIALVLALVMVLSLGTVAFAGGPLPLFDPELVGKDDGGMGRPAVVRTVLGKESYSSDLAAGFSEFAGNTLAVLLYWPAQNLAKVMKENGEVLMENINATAEKITDAANKVEFNTGATVGVTRYLTKGAVWHTRNLSWLGTGIGRMLLEDVNEIVENPTLTHIVASLKELQQNKIPTDASTCFDIIDGVCGKVVEDVITAAEIVKSVTNRVSGEVERVFASATDWLAADETYLSYEDGDEGSLSHRVYNALIWLLDRPQ